jgi:ABC-type sugar transport system substrate-binding protein
VAALALSLAALALAQAPGKPSAGPYRMGLIVKNLVNPVWIDMKRGGEAAAREFGVDLTTLAPIKPDNVEEQLRMMEDFIERKVDAIVVVPADSKGIIPGIERANRARVPVINVNTLAFGGRFETFVAVENYDAAYKVAQSMVKRLQGRGKVIILEGVPGAQSAVDLQRGTLAALKEALGITVLASQTAKFQRAEAMAVMENLIQRFPDFDAVLAANDEMALGAIEALDAARRLDRVMVSGLDANADAVRAVARGRMTVTADKRSYEQGSRGVEAAVRFLKGEKIPARIVIDTNLVDKGNVEEYLKKLSK